MQFETKVDGIPCICKVTHFYSGSPARYSGLPEFSAENDPGELEFEILDRRGRPAEWLERKLTGSDVCRIHEEFEAIKSNLEILNNE